MKAKIPSWLGLILVLGCLTLWLILGRETAHRIALLGGAQPRPERTDVSRARSLDTSSLGSGSDLKALDVSSENSVAEHPAGALVPRGKKPEGNRIEFVVVDGLAIAYGDVRLGKPDSSAAIQRGFYDAPVPQI